MTIFLSPFSRALINGAPNPKNYPYLPELLHLLEKTEHKIIQVGISPEPKLAKNLLFDLPLEKLVEKVQKEMDFFISVDNFFPHLCHYYKKRGLVLWNQSDPDIFGYKEMVNLISDRRHLRPRQFEAWTQTDNSFNGFVKPEEVLKHIPSSKHEIVYIRPTV